MEEVDFFSLDSSKGTMGARGHGGTEILKPSFLKIHGRKMISIFKRKARTWLANLVLDPEPVEGRQAV